MSSQAKKQFNLITSGYGKISRLGYYKPKKSDRILCCQISLLRGEFDDEGKIESTNIDMSVVGKKAIEILQAYAKDARPSYDDPSVPKIMAAVRVGDIYIDNYQTKDGDKKSMLKGRLLAIERLWIDNDLVYEEPKNFINFDEIRSKLSKHWDAEKIERFIDGLKAENLDDNAEQNDATSEENQE